MTHQSSIQTTDAGLLATFYGPRGELNGLCEWLEQGLGVRRGEFSAADQSTKWSKLSITMAIGMPLLHRDHEQQPVLSISPFLAHE